MAADTNIYRWTLDVDGNQLVTPQDALYIINELNHPASTASTGLNGEAESSSASRAGPLVTDVNRDGRTTPTDAILVINELNSEGESSPLVRFRVSADQVTGDPITTPISVGTHFIVTAFVQDIRDSSTESSGGVFAAYLDVLYNSGLVNFDFRELQTVSLTGTSGGSFTLSFGGETTASIANNASADTLKTALENLNSINPGDIEVSKSATRTWLVKFGNNFSNTNVPNLTGDSSKLTGSAPAINVSDNQSASAAQRFLDSITYGTTYTGGLEATNGAGLVDEAGAFASLTETGNAEFDLLRFSMQATNAGTAKLTADPAEDQDRHAVLLYTSPQQDPKVPVSQILYGETSVTIVKLVNAVDDRATVQEDSTNNLVDVLTNDTISTNGTKRIESVGTPSNGSVSIDNRGTATTTDDVLRYTPTTDFAGADTFTYVLGDGLSNTSVATVTVTVMGKNDAPTITAIGNQTIDEDTSTGALSFTINDVDNDPDTLQLTATSSDTALIPNAKVVLAGSGKSRTVTVSPALDLSGKSTITIVVSDGALQASTSFTVTVNSVNDAPINSVPGIQSTTEDNSDEPLVFSATNGNRITISDVDAGNANLVTTLSLPTGTLTIPNPAGVNLVGNGSGALTLTGTIAAINSALNGMEYRAPQIFTGQVPMTVTTNDQGNTGGATLTAKTDTDTVTIDVLPKVRPRARADSVTVAEDSANNPVLVLGNDIPNVNANVTLKSFTDGAHGKVTLFDNGTPGDATDDELRYTPDGDYSGPDSFTYVINDTLEGTINAGKDSTGTVLVTVTEVNDAPTGNDDKATTAEDVALTIAGSTLTSNDSPGPGESGQVLTVNSASMVSGANTGSVAVSKGSVVFTPGENFNGTALFTYSASDNGTTNGQSDSKSLTATVTITVTEVNDAPVAGQDTASTAEGTDVTITNLLNNDGPGGGSDEDNQVLSLTGATVVAQGAGTVSLNGNELKFSPAADFNTLGGGPVVITYQVSDNGTTNDVADPKSSTGTVLVTVTEVNDAPIANDDTAADLPGALFIKNRATTIAGSALTKNDSPGPANESSQQLTVTDVSGSTKLGGTVELVGGNVVYTPPQDVADQFDEFTITVTDNGTTNGEAGPLSDTSTVSFKILDFVPTKVGGRVYLDFNNDGKFGGNDLGLAGVEIKLAGTDLQNGVIERTVSTDRDGMYLFENLAPSLEGTSYVITQMQPLNTMDGTDTATAPVATHVQDSKVVNDAFAFSIPIEGGMELLGNNFAEVGLAPSFARLTRFYLASQNPQDEVHRILFSLGQGEDGSGLAWYSFKGGWSGFVSASLRLSADKKSADLTVSNGQTSTTRTITSPRLEVATDSAGRTCVLIRGSAEDLGFLMAQNGEGEGEYDPAVERAAELVAAMRRGAVDGAAVDAVLAGDWNA